MGYEIDIVHPWIKKKLLQRFPKAYIYKPRSGTYGKKGVSDFICCINGLFIAIEAKADETKTLTKLQEIELQKVHEAGGMRYEIYGKDEEIIKKIIHDVCKHFTFRAIL